MPWQRCGQLLPLCGFRVSIPRSALSPAHQYKAHRRRSFEPADNLALHSVSFCLPVDGTTPAGSGFIARRKENLGLIPLAVSTKIFDMCQRNTQNILWCVLSLCLCVSDIKHMTYFQCFTLHKRKCQVELYPFGAEMNDLFQALACQHHHS